MKGESVILVLPLPPRVLSPNSPHATIGGRFKKASATRRYRRLAKEAVECERIETAPWNKVLVTPTYYHARKGRRDDDNFIRLLKAAYDGIVDAGLVPDDDSEHMRKMFPTFEIDCENPRVELAVVRLA